MSANPHGNDRDEPRAVRGRRQPAEAPSGDWWAEGLLFENCSCTAVCPGHIHFSQRCTRDVCQGFWAIRFDDGRLGDVELAGTRAVVIYETPPVMIEGGWKQRIVISDHATPEQFRALEEILTGVRGGPWRILARFVANALPTRAAPIAIDAAPMAKSVTIKGMVRGAIEAIRGRNRAEPVNFVNIFNQIHDSTQVIAMGSTRCDDEDIAFSIEQGHALWSRFRWTGG